MLYPFYILLGVLPSLVWLSYFLRKDIHPESNKMVLKIFFLGMISTAPAALLEMGVSQLFLIFQKQGWIIAPFFYWVLGIALIEEFFKYLVVKKYVLKNPEFDEPIDAIFYMIIAALGFAALENILILWPSKASSSALLSASLNAGYFLEPFMVSSLRFVGATFLHALCSGTVGFFLGLSFFKKHLRRKLTILGLSIAALLHGLYNFYIIEIEGSSKIIMPAIILISLAIFVSLGLQKLRNLKAG